MGLPMAMASSPGRNSEESAAEAAGKFAASIRSCARSRRGSRERTAASNSRPSQSCTFTREPRTTCALVTTRPSLDQMTPEPAPRPPEWMRTVERRNCSAISPNPGMAMLFASMRALTDNDLGFLRHAATNQFDHNRLADCSRGKLCVHVLHSRDRMRAEGNHQVADHDAGLVRGALRFHLDDDGGGFLIAL